MSSHSIQSIIQRVYQFWLNVIIIILNPNYGFSNFRRLITKFWLHVWGYRRTSPTYCRSVWEVEVCPLLGMKLLSTFLNQFPLKWMSSHQYQLIVKNACNYRWWLGGCSSKKILAGIMAKLLKILQKQRKSQFFFLFKKCIFIELINKSHTQLWESEIIQITCTTLAIVTRAWNFRKSTNSNQLLGTNRLLVKYI